MKRTTTNPVWKRATPPAASAAESAASTQTRHDPLLLVILGPTGSGKTALSLALAERSVVPGEIVNCDSVALYRELNIGAAKPTVEERARVPHHLFDVASLDEAVTAGDYARRARPVLREIAARGKLPIVVGGTGLYLRALLEGLFPGPPRSEELRRELREVALTEAEGSASLHQMLQRLDPAAAARIHAHDAPKLIRALEVSMKSGAPMSELWQRGRDPLTGFRILRLGLDPERNALYARINQRARAMFDAGLVEETRALLAKYPGARPLQSLGYKQAGQLLRGESDRKLAIWATQQAHRNYAKRQMTWFRREPEVRWLKGFGDEAAVWAQAIELAQEALAHPG
jgi:tRNA dimethylallyltransferase